MRWPLGRRARIVFGSYWLLLANKEAPQKSKHTENAMNIPSADQITEKKVENTMILQGFGFSGDRSMIYPSKRTGPSHFPTQETRARSPALLPVFCTSMAVITAMTHAMHFLVDHHLRPPLDQRLGDPWFDTEILPIRDGERNCCCPLQFFTKKHMIALLITILHHQAWSIVRTLCGLVLYNMQYIQIPTVFSFTGDPPILQLPATVSGG